MANPPDLLVRLRVSKIRGGNARVAVYFGRRRPAVVIIIEGKLAGRTYARRLCTCVYVCLCVRTRGLSIGAAGRRRAETHCERDATVD